MHTKENARSCRFSVKHVQTDFVHLFFGRAPPFTPAYRSKIQLRLKQLTQKQKVKMQESEMDVGYLRRRREGLHSVHARLLLPVL